MQETENIQKVQKAYTTFGSKCVMIICRDERDALVRPIDNKCSGDLDIGIVADRHLTLREPKNDTVMMGKYIE